MHGKVSCGWYFIAYLLVSRFILSTKSLGGRNDYSYNMRSVSRASDNFKHAVPCVDEMALKSVQIVSVRDIVDRFHDVSST